MKKLLWSVLAITLNILESIAYQGIKPNKWNNKIDLLILKTINKSEVIKKWQTKTLCKMWTQALMTRCCNRSLCRVKVRTSIMSLFSMKLKKIFLKHSLLLLTYSQIGTHSQDSHKNLFCLKQQNYCLKRKINALNNLKKSYKQKTVN